MNIPNLPNYPDITAPISEWRRILEPLTLEQLSEAHYQTTRHLLKLEPAHWHLPAVEVIRDLIMSFISEALRRQSKQAQEAILTVKLLNELRAGEGDSVTILCDKPDFDDRPNNAIECNGEWTRWKDRRFEADSVIECLQLAAAALRQWRGKAEGVSK